MVFTRIARFRLAAFFLPEAIHIFVVCPVLPDRCPRLGHTERDTGIAHGNVYR